MRARGALRAVRCACEPPPSSIRTGANVSFVTRPDHVRFQSASITDCSFSASASWRSCAAKYAPPPASAATRRASSESGASSSSRGSRVSGAVSAGCSAIQPSRPGSDPCPDQMTSPVAVSSSSIAGE